MNKVSLILLLTSLLACGKASKIERKESTTSIDTAQFKIKETGSVKMVKGQLLYVPIYSNLPHGQDTTKLDISAFLAIHNIDIKHKLRISQILFCNTAGKQVKDFLGKKEITLEPLETKTIYIPHEDQSGTGANFLVEWYSNEKMVEPLIESIMVNTVANQNVSFTSSAKIIREK